MALTQGFQGNGCGARTAAASAAGTGQITTETSKMPSRPSRSVVAFAPAEIPPTFARLVSAPPDLILGTVRGGPFVSAARCLAAWRYRTLLSPALGS
jgi:hypothetical protein